jgi:hypothetical protein
VDLKINSALNLMIAGAISSIADLAALIARRFTYEIV